MKEMQNQKMREVTDRNQRTWAFSPHQKNLENLRGNAHDLKKKKTKQKK